VPNGNCVQYSTTTGICNQCTYGYYFNWGFTNLNSNSSLTIVPAYLTQYTAQCSVCMSNCQLCSQRYLICIIIAMPAFNVCLNSGLDKTINVNHAQLLDVHHATRWSQLVALLAPMGTISFPPIRQHLRLFHARFVIPIVQPVLVPNNASNVTLVSVWLLVCAINVKVDAQHVTQTHWRALLVSL